MEPRSVDQWTAKLGELPAPDGENVECLIANSAINGLVGYRQNAKERRRDTQELANAMTAYARMMFDAGVRP